MIKPKGWSVLIALISLSLVFNSSVSAKTVTGFGSCTVNNQSHLLSPSFFTDTGTIVIPFEYKQSAIYHANTLEVVDSIVNILVRNKEIKISINGYAHLDEGRDSICYYLSLNRALFIRDYIIGRGIDSSRIKQVVAYGNTRPFYKGTDKKGNILNCRAEIKFNYPEPPKKPEIIDTDKDGIPDSEDGCPDQYGYKENNGCPEKDVVKIPFPFQQNMLEAEAYQVLDSVIQVLKQNPTYTISIEGHADKEEGIQQVVEGLGKDRAELIKSYLLSRYVGAVRIASIRYMGSTRPLNAGSSFQEMLFNARTEIRFIKNSSDK